MESNRHTKAMVVQPRKNEQNTDDQPKKVSVKIVRTNGRKTKSSRIQAEREVVDRLITRMVKPTAYPPSYNALPLRTCRRRWVSGEAAAISSRSFRLTEGHRQFLVVTTANTTAECYADCWRIKSISIWCINYQDNATTVTLYPVTSDIDSNCFNDREAAFTCSSRSQAKPGSMTIVPARDTPLGSWHKTSTVNSSGSLFVINADYGGASSGNWATITMDIEFEYIENLFGNPQGFSVTISATAPNGTLGGADIFLSTGLPEFELQDINRLI